MIKNLVHALDACLWRRGVQHPQIRLVVRNVIVAALAGLLAGAACFYWTPAVFWFGVGLALLAQVFWGLAHFFLRTNLLEYTTALLMVALLRATGRLLLTGVVLYVALVWCRAPVWALLGGLVANTAVALGSYGLAGRTGHNC
jgi:hypothetical protein